MPALTRFVEAPQHLTKMSGFWVISITWILADFEGFPAHYSKIGPSLEVYFPSHYESDLGGDDPP